MTLLLLFILILVTQLAYFQLAYTFHIVDKPNVRSSHSTVTYRGGGIVFSFSVLYFFLMQGFTYPWFFIGLFILSAISFADDIKSISFKIRLPFQLLAALLLLYQLNLELPWYVIVVAVVFATGVLNAYNFMDGINGMTGGYSFIVLASFWYFNNFHQAFVDNELLYAVMMALLVFNFFNFRKQAKCFAGDVGSISIALIILLLMGLLIQKTNDIHYLLLLSVYGIDSVSTIVHRLYLKENIASPHRKHLFQILANELKMPHLLVSGIYCLVQTGVVLLLIGFEHRIWISFGVLAFLLVTYILLMKKYYRLHVDC